MTICLYFCLLVRSNIQILLVVSLYEENGKMDVAPT